MVSDETVQAAPTFKLMVLVQAQSVKKAVSAVDIEREAVTSIGLAYYAMRESDGLKSLEPTKDGPEKLQSL